MGSLMLSWAEDYARSENCGFIRLDCRDSNPVLKEYDANQDFIFPGQAQGKFVYSLFEKKLQASFTYGLFLKKFARNMARIV